MPSAAVVTIPLYKSILLSVHVCKSAERVANSVFPEQMPHSGICIKCQTQFSGKLEMCPQYTDAPAVGYLTIKLQISTWYKCLNLSLTGSRMYVHTFAQKDVHLYLRTHVCTYGKLEN